MIGVLLSGNQFGGPVTIGDITINVPQAASAPWTKVRVVGSIPLPAPNIQQRTTLLTCAENGPPSGQFVVSGMGGVGKTQLAVAFARELISRDQLSLVVWVPASSRTEVLTAYAAAAHAAELGADAPEEARIRFRDWLSTTDRRWAIILDDLSDPADLRELWPPNVPSGTTVVTTRRRDTTLLATRTLIDLDVFTPDQSRAYLTERLTPHLADDIDGIGADLGYLPLALSHAAAYLLDRNLRASAYRRQFADQKRQLPKLFPAASQLFDSDTSATVATTWSMSIEHADEQEPRRLARPLLALASLLDPNAIPLAVFDAAATRDYLAAVTMGDCDDGAGVDASDIQSGLANLRRFNLISIADPVVRVHALVQRAVRETLPRDQLIRVVRCAADALKQTWPIVEQGSDAALVLWLRSNTGMLVELLATENLWASAENAGEVVLRRVESISNAALARAAFDEATRLYEQTDRQLGAQHRITLKARHHIADITGELGDPGGAVRAYEALLADDLRYLPPDHPDTLHTRSNLAYRRAEAGDPWGAAAAFAALRDDYIKRSGPDHLDSLTTEQLYADCLGETGDAHGAITVLQPLLEKELRILRPKHPHTSVTRNSLAQWRGTCGDTASAVTLMRQVLADRLDTRGPDHVATLNARTNLAQWLGKAGDPATAASMLEVVAADRIRLLGARHLSTMTTLRALIRWHGECGNAAGAVAALDQLLIEMDATIAPQHPEILRTRFDLGHWRARAGDLPGALAALDDVLRAQTMVLGADHPETLATRNDLAWWRGTAGEARTAYDELCGVLADRIRVLGADTVDTLATRSALAHWQAESGDADGACADLVELLEDCDRILNPGHPLTVSVSRELERWRAQS
jgi:hypothetical protein